jgi:hypothetical protein
VARRPSSAVDVCLLENRDELGDGGNCVGAELPLVLFRVQLQALLRIAGGAEITLGVRYRSKTSISVDRSAGTAVASLPAVRLRAASAGPPARLCSST